MTCHRCTIYVWAMAFLLKSSVTKYGENSFFTGYLNRFFVDFLFHLISERGFLIRCHVLACCYTHGLYMCQELIRSLLEHHLFSIWYGSQTWDANGIAICKSAVGIQLKCDAIWNLLSSFCCKPIQNGSYLVRRWISILKSMFRVISSMLAPYSVPC